MPPAQEYRVELYRVVPRFDPQSTQNSSLYPLFWGWEAHIVVTRRGREGRLQDGRREGFGLLLRDFWGLACKP